MKRYKDCHIFDNEYGTYDCMVKAFEKMPWKKTIIDVYDEVVPMEKHPYIDRNDSWVTMEDELMNHGKVEFDSKLHRYEDIEYRHVVRALVIRMYGEEYLLGYVSSYTKIDEEIEIKTYKQRFKHGTMQENIANKKAAQKLETAIENKKRSIYESMEESVNAANNLKTVIVEDDIIEYY